ncbi:hypothetical protein C7437_1171 [Psychrobacillus insolitus]|uniref:DUF5348 domain-containing protein n=1 Tax=Psychrobacillus insolitus TaxID=1461 RepID=A0A2W7P6U1_9BACI|nr:DUF5348 domain-containing protein [Psychrobacillus insolitus]PZX01259.1 hypothetical protein C7437_1171 [Psychrobacillus insolitus]
MIGLLTKNLQGRYAFYNGFYFTTGDAIEIKLDYNHWVQTIIKHKDEDYYLRDFPNLKIEGLTARKVV